VLALHSQPKGIKLNMRQRKLRNGVNWQQALKQKGVTQQLGVYMNDTTQVMCIVLT
jgi:hypothetical protein